MRIRAVVYAMEKAYTSYNTLMLVAVKVRCWDRSWHALTAMIFVISSGVKDQVSCPAPVEITVQKVRQHPRLHNISKHR
jgi:hypothetical protein